MNKGKLKVLVRALKEIVEELESELYTDSNSSDSFKYENYKEMSPPSDDDYDEVF